MYREGQYYYKNIGIYVRESRDDNEENYETIETQRDLLIDFINKNKLGELYKVYIDNNVSGAAFDRSALNQLKEDVIEGRIDLLLLKDLSRLGRNNAKTLLFLDFLEEHGVRVITIDGRYDSLKDNEMVGIETWFNERYLLDISRKIRTNLRFKIQRGEYIGKAPFGYKKSTKEKNRLCVDGTTAAIVKEIFKLYLEGYGYAYIANLLNQKGYPSPSGKQGGWTPVAIQRILSNRVYIGDTVQGVSEKISYKSKKTRRLPASKWVITKNTHEAIIEKETFEEVQRLRKTKSEAVAGPHKGTIHVFRGLIYCGRCGSAMYARARENRPIGYVCGNYYRNGKTCCSSHHVSECEIMEILMDELKELLGKRQIFEQAKKLFQESIEKEYNLDNDIKYLEKQLQQKKKQQEILYMDRLEGKVTVDFFTKINEGLEKSIKYILNEIERLKNIKCLKINVDSTVDMCIENIFKEGISNKMARELIEKVTVFELEKDRDKIMSVLTENHHLLYKSDISCTSADERELFMIPESGKALVVDFKFNKE